MLKLLKSADERRVIAAALLAIVFILLVGYAIYLRISPVPSRRDFVGVIRIEGYIEEPSPIKRNLTPVIFLSLVAFFFVVSPPAVMSHELD